MWPYTIALFWIMSFSYAVVGILDESASEFAWGDPFFVVVVAQIWEQIYVGSIEILRGFTGFCGVDIIPLLGISHMTNPINFVSSTGTNTCNNKTGIYWIWAVETSKLARSVFMQRAKEATINVCRAKWKTNLQYCLSLVHHLLDEKDDFMVVWEGRGYGD